MVTRTPREICLEVMSEEIEEKRLLAVKEKVAFIQNKARECGRAFFTSEYYQDGDLIAEGLQEAAKRDDCGDEVLAFGLFKNYILERDGELPTPCHTHESFDYVYLTFGDSVDDDLEAIDKKYPEIHNEYDPMEDPNFGKPTKKGETNMKVKNPVMVEAGKKSRITHKINILKRQYDAATTTGVKSGITKKIKKLLADK